MTHLESLMLSVCFGTCVGLIISGWGIIIKCKIDDYREKKKQQKEEE